MCFVESTHISQIIAAFVVNKLAFDESHTISVFVTEESNIFMGLVLVTWFVVKIADR